MAQHTSGPWGTIREVDSLITITAPNGWGLAEVVAEDPFGQITPDVAEANANLIAAAPDEDACLEAALYLIGGWRELIAALDDMPKDEALGKAMWAALDQIDNWKGQARSAIAKARGQAVQS